MPRRTGTFGTGPRTITLTLICCALAVAGPAGSADAQAPTVRERLRAVDSTRVQILMMADESRLVGRITSIDEDSLVFAAGANTLVLAIADVIMIHEMSADDYRRTGFWFEHPNLANLVLGPTGRTLPRGSGYVSLHELFFPTVNYGFTNYITIGGGATLVPGIPLDEQLLYFLPKVAVVRSPRANVALGALVFRAADLFGERERPDLFGVTYGVATFGSPDANLTTGLAFPFYGDDLDSRPLTQVGGQVRFASRGALISENWMYRSNDDTHWISWTGIRFLDQTTSFDVAIAFAPGAAGWIPWVGVAKGF